MSNRVDDLESEIAELRAAVNGLTEELVETKARVRELEADAETNAATDTQTDPTAGETDFVDADPVDAGPTTTMTKSDDHVNVVEREPAETETVADKAGGASEGDNSPEQQESTEDDADQGDIIVA